MRKYGDYHVIPAKAGGWEVKREHESGNAQYFEKQKDAIDAARKMSQSTGAALYIHAKDGTVRKKENHRSDPFQF
ncbi:MULTISPECIES: DUF2188 domain-containing protein [unclassified Legionella]|uniref:DUF2188 domain-containing protein n=1 Tax=unclassified Legionella TaxID=2622702 RepID=UPI00105500E4|nr:MULTISPECIES: DUF2188 domain-containing protein [unclassified Legionella]MDI9818242.1 DUF2188 domain-containing protein [Legionella sp. PL877]